jgi:hypothetical protein
MPRCRWFISISLCLAGAAPAALAQGNPSSCHALCAPVVALMPAMIRSHLFGGPFVQSLSTGATQRLSSSSSFEMIVAASARTAIPRLSAFASVQWLPNASEARNPFTLYAAAETGGPMHANAPTSTVGLSLTSLTATQTHGWVDAGVSVGALFSQASRPTDRSSYTAKADLELVSHLHVFNAIAASTWLHRTSLFAILDYVASGLPRAGDEVPKGRRFLGDARPAALIFGLAIPITPEGI